jgi:hypothetical protein
MTYQLLYSTVEHWPVRCIPVQYWTVFLPEHDGNKRSSAVFFHSSHYENVHGRRIGNHSDWMPPQDQLRSLIVQFSTKTDSALGCSSFSHTSFSFMVVPIFRTNRVRAWHFTGHQFLFFALCCRRVKENSHVCRSNFSFFSSFRDDEMDGRSKFYSNLT